MSRFDISLWVQSLMYTYQVIHGMSGSIFKDTHRNSICVRTFIGDECLSELYCVITKNVIHGMPSKLNVVKSYNPLA